MTEERETKNTVRFAEDPAPELGGETDPAIGTVYVPKATLNELSKGRRVASPMRIRLTIEVLA